MEKVKWSHKGLKFYDTVYSAAWFDFNRNMGFFIYAN